MIDQKYAVIAHLDILAALDGEAKCRLVLVDLEAGRHAGALCVAAREWEKRVDVFSIPTDDLCVSVPVEPTSSAESGNREVPEPSDLVTEGVASSAEEPIAAPAIPPAVEQPAPAALGAAGAQDAGPIDFKSVRRAMLLERHDKLTKDDKREFKRLRSEYVLNEAKAGHRVNPKDLDVVEMILNWLKPFDEGPLPSQPAPAPTMPPEPRLRFTGDEGGDVSESDIGWMRRRFDELTSEQREPLTAIVVDARAVGGITLSARPSLRRFKIYNALIVLARYGWDDDVVRAACAMATGHDDVLQPGIPLGTVVGMLDVHEAERFADIAARLDDGTLGIRFKPDGSLRLVETVGAT